MHPAVLVSLLSAVVVSGPNDLVLCELREPVDERSLLTDLVVVESLRGGQEGLLQDVARVHLLPELAAEAHPNHPADPLVVALEEKVERARVTLLGAADEV